MWFGRPSGLGRVLEEPCLQTELMLAAASSLQMCCLIQRLSLCRDSSSNRTEPGQVPEPAPDPELTPVLTSCEVQSGTRSFLLEICCPRIGISDAAAILFLCLSEDRKRCPEHCLPLIILHSDVMSTTRVTFYY